MLTGKNIFKIKVGQTIEFTYNDKPRRVVVERVVLPPLCSHYANAYFNGPELTDGGQIKSFTFSKVQGNGIVVANS